MNEILVYVIIALATLNVLFQSARFAKNKTCFGGVLFAVFCLIWISATLLIPIQHRKSQAINEMKILTETINTMKIK